MIVSTIGTSKQFSTSILSEFYSLIEFAVFSLNNMGIGLYLFSVWEQIFGYMNVYAVPNFVEKARLLMSLNFVSVDSWFILPQWKKQTSYQVPSIQSAQRAYYYVYQMTPQDGSSSLGFHLLSF